MATVQPPARLLDDSFLKFLPAPLREPRRAWLAILTGWALSLLGSIALATLSKFFAPALPAPEFAMKGPLVFLLLVLFAPLVETLIMGGVLSLLLRIANPTVAILLSAFGWGLAHSSQALGWGLVIWWPFLIFSTLYVVWRQRGFWVAIGVVTATHALQNLGPSLLVAFG